MRRDFVLCGLAAARGLLSNTQLVSHRPLALSFLVSWAWTPENYTQEHRPKQLAVPLSHPYTTYTKHHTQLLWSRHSLGSAARRIVCFVARAVARIIEEAFRGVITLTAAHLGKERARALCRFRHRKRNYSVIGLFLGA